MQYMRDLHTLLFYYIHLQCTQFSEEEVFVEMKKLCCQALLLANSYTTYIPLYRYKG